MTSMVVTTRPVVITFDYTIEDTNSSNGGPASVSVTGGTLSISNLELRVLLWTTMLHRSDRRPIRVPKYSVYWTTILIRA